MIPALLDGPLREQLIRALEGRGAFRRLRKVLEADAWQDQLTRWTLFRYERQLGRAREWLARAGYRPVQQADGTSIGAVTQTHPAD